MADRVTIVPDDNIVLVNGVARSVNCSELTGLHAVQIYPNGYMEVEFSDSPEDDKAFKANARFDGRESGFALSMFQPEIDAWATAAKE